LGPGARTPNLYQRFGHVRLGSPSATMSLHEVSPPRTSTFLWTAGVLLTALASCHTPAEHSAAADDEVYAIVAERRAELAATGDFRIAAPEGSLRTRILEGERPAELSALTLVDCQRIAAENSRSFQSRRESLYLAALDLTLQRYAFGLSIGAGAGAGISGNENEATSYDADGVLSLQKVLGGGASVVLDIGASFFESLASGSPSELFADLGLTVTRPLLGAASEEAIFESLTNAERRVVDEARRYERFRRTFAVDVYSRYWRILQETQVTQNEVTNFANLQLLADRNRALGEAGRLADIQVGESNQDELRASSRVIDAKGRLEGLYDDFKFFLGLPVDVEIVLDPTDFALATETGLEGLERMDLGLQPAIDLALVQRLDLATARDELLDAERSLRIAEERLGSRLDLTVNAGASTQIQPGVDFNNGSMPWSLGLDYDSPLDRFSERNSYRSAQIALEARRRSLDEAEDLLRIDVRENLRRLREAEQNYAIQLNSVASAERRVESAELSLEAGRAETRFLLDARSDLLDSLNSSVGALVNYNLARLDLYLDMELLEVDESGLRFGELPTNDKTTENL